MEPANSLNIKEEDKFFSRLMSKDSSATSSQHYYYVGASVGVPFMWESRPGTPKHVILSEESYSCLTPPLTPPPYYNNPTSSIQMMNRKTRKFSWLTKFLVFKSSSSSSSTASQSTSHSSSSNYSSLTSFGSSSSSSSSMNLHHHWHGLRFRWFSLRSRTNGHKKENEEQFHRETDCASGFLQNRRSCFGFINKRRKKMVRNLKSARS